MWRVAYKVSDVVVDSTPVILVSDSVDGSVDSGMSNIVIESNDSIHSSGISRYLTPPFVLLKL